MNRNQAWHAAAFGVFAAYSVTWAFGRHHDHVNACLWLNEAKVHVQTVGKCDRCAFADVVVDVFFICFGLKFVGHCEHDDIAPCGRFGDPHDFEAFAFGFGG